MPLKIITTTKEGFRKAEAKAFELGFSYEGSTKPINLKKDPKHIILYPNTGEKTMAIDYFGTYPHADITLYPFLSRTTDQFIEFGIQTLNSSNTTTRVIPKKNRRARIVKSIDVETDVKTIHNSVREAVESWPDEVGSTSAIYNAIKTGGVYMNSTWEYFDY